MTPEARPGSDLHLAQDAAREAGRAVMRHFGGEHDVRYKGLDQPVTAADLEADAILRQRLQGERPHYGWLSEESADSPERLARERVWVVDPIDGTNSFVEGLPEFVISIGLAERGRVVLAVLLNPVTDELYHAVLGEGSFLNGSPIAVAPPPDPGGKAVLLASRSELSRGELEGYDSTWRVTPLGSTAYRMAKVADGTGHAFFSRGPKAEWDVCGATLVVREAGGQVRTVDGEELLFNQPEPTFRGIVCFGSAATDPLPPRDALRDAP